MHCLLSEQAYILCRSRRDGGMIFLGEGVFIPHLGSAALDRRPSSLCLLCVIWLCPVVQQGAYILVWWHSAQSACKVLMSIQMAPIERSFILASSISVCYFNASSSMIRHSAKDTEVILVGSCSSTEAVRHRYFASAGAHIAQIHRAGLHKQLGAAKQGLHIQADMSVCCVLSCILCFTASSLLI